MTLFARTGTLSRIVTILDFLLRGPLLDGSTWLTTGFGPFDFAQDGFWIIGVKLRRKRFHRFFLRVTIRNLP
jgi:hypothetical protein